MQLSGKQQFILDKRWVDIVAKVVGTHDPDELMMAEDVVKLLARQHRAFVRMVKASKKKHEKELLWCMACDDLLAALATHRKGRT